MIGLGETSPFHWFTNPRRGKSVYFWPRGSYLYLSVINDQQNQYLKANNNTNIYIIEHVSKHVMKIR